MPLHFKSRKKYRKYLSWRKIHLPGRRVEGPIFIAGKRHKIKRGR